MEVMEVLKLVAVFASLAFAVGATYWMAYDFGKRTQKNKCGGTWRIFPMIILKKLRNVQKSEGRTMQLLNGTKDREHSKEKQRRER